VAFRIIAPKKQRVERIMERRQCERHEAERFVDETDAGRAEFIQRYFHRETADPNLYDLVLNLKYMSLDEAVDLMVTHCRIRFAPAIASQPIVHPR
jgi:cytidylate kinase